MSYLTDDPIDRDVLVSTVARPADGACLIFEGVVRNHNDGREVDSIFYDAYRPMAEKEVHAVLLSVRQQWPDVSIAVAHRLGELRVGDASIVIVCSSPHRAESFDACRAVIDRIKQTVPIWKRERGPRGEEWVGWQGQHSPE